MNSQERNELLSDVFKPCLGVGTTIVDGPIGTALEVGGTAVVEGIKEAGIKIKEYGEDGKINAGETAAIVGESTIAGIVEGVETIPGVELCLMGGVK